MKITQLTIYPIKSLRGISLPTTTLTPTGLLNDRTYILLKPSKTSSYEGMFIGFDPSMALFHPSLSPLSPSTHFTISYRTPSPPLFPPVPQQNTTIEIPFKPDLESLDRVGIKMFSDEDFGAYVLGKEVNEWFSACFGFPVLLAYIGGSGLNEKPPDEKVAEGWKESLKKEIPGSLSGNVKFSDGAALLVATESSFADLVPRIGSVSAENPKIEMERFRPNIILDGPPNKPWDEDHWTSIRFPFSNTKILLTSNCTRCISVNVDLDKGKVADGESGQLLKKMMKDRRIDKGKKWEPVFGRYGFPVNGGSLRVGDEVVVGGRSEGVAVWNGTIPRLAKFKEDTSSQEGFVSQLRKSAGSRSLFLGGTFGISSYGMVAVCLLGIVYKLWISSKEIEELR